MGTHNKQTRIKDFEGLPHSLKGLDYTDDAEVEGGEKGYTPLGSKNEFIFRNISRNIAELQKEDKLRENRPKGDRISDQSFDAAAANVIMKEIKDLVSEGIDPFNVEGNQQQNAFKTGGVKYATGGFTNEPDPRYTVPTIDDNAVQPTENKSVNMGQIANYAQAAGQLGTNLAQISTADTSTGTKVDQGINTTVDTVMGAATPWYGAAKGLADTFTGFTNTEEQDVNGVQTTVSTDNVSAGFNAAIRPAHEQGINSFTQAANLKGKEKTAKVFEGIGDMLGFTTIPKMIQGFTEGDPNYTDTSKQADYDATLAARGRFEGEGDIPRTRYNDQTIMRNGGVKKKYAGNEGSVRKPYGELDYEEFDFNFAPTEDPSLIDPQRYSNVSVMPKIEDQYSIAPTEQIDPVTGEKKKMTPEQIQQLYQGILGFGTNAAGSIAYLAGEGKDYDKVKYPTYRPEQITADAQLRESRDQSASTIEALRKQGKLDPNALAQLATSGAKSTAGIRENVANYNIGNRNQAHQFNIGTNIRAQQDEAANKGQALTNYYTAIENLGKSGAGTTNQASAIDNDKMILAMYENVFGKNKVV